jgi:hypothetical protein
VKTRTVRIDFDVDRRLAASLLLYHNRNSTTVGLSQLNYGARAVRDSVRDALYDHGASGASNWTDYCSEHDVDARQAWADRLVAAAYPELCD